ncbi:MAG: DUF6452 family protein [Bacteroides sp.]|nr:DUF6452 family protein [Bacteroides sp.]
MKYMALPLIFLLLITSCGTQDVCDDDNQSYLVARFKTTDISETRDSIIADISIYGIREGKADSLIYNTVSTSRIELPLDQNNEFTSFVLSNTFDQDTLILSHSSEVYLINYTCGFASRFIMDQASDAGRWMLELEVRDKNIDAEMEPDEEHLWIYF